MEKLQFLFLYMDPNNDPAKHRAQIENNGGITYICGVSNIEQAKEVAKKAVAQEGVELIELCGAFGEEGARQIIEATENKAAVGYVVHLPEQNPLFKRLFG